MVNHARRQHQSQKPGGGIVGPLTVRGEAAVALPFGPSRGECVTDAVEQEERETCFCNEIVGNLGMESNLGDLEDVVDPAVLVSPYSNAMP